VKASRSVRIGAVVLAVVQLSWFGFSGRALASHTNTRFAHCHSFSDHRVTGNYPCVDPSTGYSLWNHLGNSISRGITGNPNYIIVTNNGWWKNYNITGVYQSTEQRISLWNQHGPTGISVLYNTQSCFQPGVCTFGFDMGSNSTHPWSTHYSTYTFLYQTSTFTDEIPSHRHDY
jgi:hypothetical protein